MIPEVGHFALILALSLSICQCVLPLVGAQRNDRAMMAVARPAALGQFVFVAISFACLTWSFLQSDFSVLYVANHSQLALPIPYKISAVWGAHEGSLLLWVLLLAGWTVLVCRYSGELPEKFSARVIAVLGGLSVGFLLFTLLTSNPFERLLPAAADGADLNPLLQDPGLAIHPPLLYVGYVGFSVAFAFAIAAMISGDLDQKWARWTRPWTTSAWLFLTVGIALGSWWAYYELGWGGWWFWDPVENASFMPWLIGTALIHSLAVTEKRGLFKSWTLLLAISAFSLSLLGTFLVRSGILVSVHAFAVDPERGLFILAFLAIVIGGALTLYAWRAPSLDSEAGFRPMSRETFLLLNNVLLVIATALILGGTLAPLFVELMDGSKISVGPPYFAIAFAIPMVPLVLLMAVGMHIAWRNQAPQAVVKKLRLPMLVAVVIGVLIPVIFYGGVSVMLIVGAVAGVWVMLASVIDPIRSWRRGAGSASLTRGALGMSVAHFGVGMFVLGVTVVSAFTVEADRSLRIGDRENVAGYEFELRGLKNVAGPNYQALEGEVDIYKDGDFIGQLRPQKRTYLVQQSPMTEAGINAGWNRDLFVALGDPLGNDTWSVRLQYKPLIRFIWLGAFIMAFGGLIAASDRRYRLKAQQKRTRRRAARRARLMLKFAVPLVAFGLLVGVFIKGLDPERDLKELPSPFLGKEAPSFDLPRLKVPNERISNQVYAGEVALVNFWATWCVGCRQEHAFLMELSRTSDVPIYGIDWRDQREPALQWLNQLGDPYVASGFDADSVTGINWGVYGAPETFLIGKDGRVLVKHLGPLNRAVWGKRLLAGHRGRKWRVIVRRVLFCVIFLLGSWSVWAIDTGRAFEDDEMQARYDSIISEVRCVQCQNQTIKDSNVQIASDLRREIRRLLSEGKADSEVFSFLVERYGEFVLYRPPMSGVSLLLWIAPGVFLLLGGIVAVRVVIKRMSMPLDADDEEIDSVAS